MGLRGFDVFGSCGSIHLGPRRWPDTGGGGGGAGGEEGRGGVLGSSHVVIIPIISSLFVWYLFFWGGGGVHLTWWLTDIRGFRGLGLELVLRGLKHFGGYEGVPDV